MHHLYPLAKGDPLCPLGFHPQVRWPTRCKRCFRDYKEHGGKRKDEETSLRRDDTTSSTPSLSWSSRESDGDKRRSWVSSTNLASDRGDSNNQNSVDNGGGGDRGGGNPSSWTSTPDLANLEDDTQAAVTTFSIKLPRRKPRPIEAGQRTGKDQQHIQSRQSSAMTTTKSTTAPSSASSSFTFTTPSSVSDSFSVVKRTTADSINHNNSSTSNSNPVFNRSDSLAMRAKKMKAIKESEEKVKRIQIKEVRTISEEPTNHDVQFLIQVKTKPSNSTNDYKNQESENEVDDDTLSTAGTETTDTTLVDVQDNDMRDQLESLRKELESTKSKCDRLEREKSDILLRRLAAMETTTSKTTASEVLKLQQKCNEMQQSLEDYKDEKRSLTLKVKELEEELEQRPTAQSAQKIADELRSKLLAAETLCEELMDENEDMKKELRDMEEQMDEMQDNFREDQAVEYTSLKKELDQTTKNCRILSFKLRKAERKTEQLEQEKNDIERKMKEVSGGQAALANLERIKQLEQDLKVSNEISMRLQKEVDEANQKLSKVEESSKSQQGKKKAPMLGSIGKLPSADGKVSRESLTRGGSQDDPVQLLRDLQVSLEREADLRGQLKFAEEEAENLRKKASRIEDDNESLVLQLKKMATRARSRKLSPTNIGSRLSEPSSEKHDSPEGDEDPAEIRLQLELSEQEASVLRRKVEELEAENHRIKTKNKDLQDKLMSKSTTKLALLDNEKGHSLLDQKLKVLEDEANDLRKKLIEKERDCERLHAELSLNQKRPKNVQKTKSLDLDQQTLDLKRQLQIIEQEAAVLRTKVQSLESENEKLTVENKRLQLLRGTKSLKSDKYLDKYIDQIASLEVELAERDDKIRELESKMANMNPMKTIKDASRFQRFMDRTPKKTSSLTSKDQLRTMVNDLESEIGEMLVAIKASENERIQLEEEVKKLRHQNEVSTAMKELEELNEKFERMKQELSGEREKLNQEITKNDDLNKTLMKTKESLTRANQEKKRLKEQLDKSKEEQQRVLSEKHILDEEVNQLRANLKSAATRQDELTLLTQKAETLKLSLDSKDKELKNTRKELEDKAQQVKDLFEKCTKLAEVERKLIETEGKLKKSEKLDRDKIKELEALIDGEKLKHKSRETEQASLLSKWNEEKKKYESQIEELNNKILTLETTIMSKNKLIQHLEENLKKEKEAASKTNLKVGELENKEIVNLKDELKKAKQKLAEVESKLEVSQKNQKNLDEKLRITESDTKSYKLTCEKKVGELEIELQNEKKKNEILKRNHEKEKKNKELELTTLKNKIRTLETNSAMGTKKVAEIKQFQETIERLEANLAKERKKYEELTARYEILEEEHVITKAKLVMEKETLENQLAIMKREFQDLESELKTVKETFAAKQEEWNKEKLNWEKRLGDLEKRNGNNSDLEKTRLRASLEEKQSELDNIKREHEMMNDQMEFMRKETDELRKKLDDYEKVNKVQRNISADSSAMEKEMKQLRAKLTSLEKSKKLELADYKMRYDNQLSIVNGELQQLQSQIMRFKRERDTYKHMLESAQKTIGDLKNSPKTMKKDVNNAIHYDELDEAKTKIATLEQQISCMEDELSEARLESSRLKTELVSERSSWEVKISELRSRVNELEEEKILSSGRTKIAGLRTRMELAWQKEREEQQRLLQETATLARDLRQTLFEVERERDKERLEIKRKQEQFKKTSEEDQDENKRKITELQCDLLELRDAHAKLRTTNEKLRREKERYEREREDLKLLVSEKKKSGQDDDKRIALLIDQIDVLKQVAPELFYIKNKDGSYTPTPPRRRGGSKSRETSPAMEGTVSATENKQQEIHHLMQRLANTADDLRKYQKSNEDEYERERIKRSLGGIRRATSTEHETSSDSRYGSKPFARRKNSTAIDNTLHRKSLSLEHTIQDEQKIWKNDNNDSMSSLQSLDMTSDVENRWPKRDASLDSRLSGGSTQSDFVGEKKKKKGIIGKLKKLTKSRSIDDDDPGVFSPTKTISSRPNSNTDVNEEKGSKKDLKERITGIFKKSGSSSRSNSVERQNEVRQDTSSTHRPLTRNSSQTNLNAVAATSPTPSASPAEEEKTVKGKRKKV